MSAEAGARPVTVCDGWALRALVALTQGAHECLARAGGRQLEEGPESVPEDAARFMNDLSGGGSRTMEAARRVQRSR